MENKEKDAVTGTETTGHEWDGIKELNTPLPRWWLYTFYVTIAWALVYWALYPAWPTLADYTKGVLGFSSRAELAQDLKMQKQERSFWIAKFETKSVEEIAADPELLRYAMIGGKFVFNENCAPCHGAGGQGAPAYPVLADNDWLWGGTLADIEATIRYGVRADHDDTRQSEMPPFGDGTLSDADIGAVADYVVSLSSGAVAPGQGKAVFDENCAACHGEDGKGMTELGAPNLADAIWLYSKDRDAIMAQVKMPRHGVMPAWEGRLDGNAIKQAAIYVHSRGGGQ